MACSMGTISAIVSFEDEDSFLYDMQRAVEMFHDLSQRYGVRNVVLKLITWDSVEVIGGAQRESLLLRELPLDVPWVSLFVGELRRTLEEKGSDELDVEDIKAAVDAVNEAVGEEVLGYDAYDIGLRRNQAYLVVDVAALYYLESVVEPDDRDELYEAASILSGWLRVV